MQRLAFVGETVLGVMLALVPMLLWVAWTPFLLAAVLAAGAISAALLVLLHAAIGDPDAPAGRDPRAALPDAFVEEIHRIFPLTYHHSFTGADRFRRAMESLRRLLP
jgi:hypothetical protein